MFERWLAQIRGQTSAAASPVAEDRMAEAVALWGGLYRGQAPWLAKGGGLELPAAIACELARQTTLELESRVDGSERARFLDGQYQAALTRLRPGFELGCATGGLVMKPYPDGQGGIAVDFVGADRFLPTGFDSRGKLTGAVFAETAAEGGERYLRCEAHLWRDGVYTVRNAAFRQDGRGGPGTPVPLHSVSCWAGLSEQVCLEGVPGPLFGFFRVPQANWVDPCSPLGVSVYSRAVELIRQADEQWERILWEYEGGELAVGASSDLFRMTEDGR